MAGDEPGDDNTTKHQWFLLLLQVPGSHQSDKKQNEDSIRVKKKFRELLPSIKGLSGWKELLLQKKAPTIGSYTEPSNFRSSQYTSRELELDKTFQHKPTIYYSLIRVQFLQSSDTWQSDKKRTVNELLLADDCNAMN